MKTRSIHSLIFGICATALSLAPAYGADLIIGARPAPPKGAGPGELVTWQSGSDETDRVPFGEAGTPAGNSFYAAFDPVNQRVYVPTAAGRTDIFDASSMNLAGSMTSIRGGRVAGVSPDGSVLLVISGKQAAGYSTSSRKQLFTVPAGGNAVAFDEQGRYAYVGGNRDDAIKRIDIAQGKISGEFPVAHSGDLIRVHNKLYSADMKTGVMSVVDLNSGKVTEIKTPEVDPQFDYQHIGAAHAGFMQLAADPSHHRVYAAGFSGHILVFDSDAARYLGEIEVDAGPRGGPDKLSGLAVFDGGDKALVTVENLDTAVVVDLESKKITRQLNDSGSNRWVVLGNRR